MGCPGVGIGMGCAGPPPPGPDGWPKGEADCARAWVAWTCWAGGVDRMPDKAPLVALVEKAERELEEIMRSTIARIGK
jgi:hypothetical protein